MIKKFNSDSNSITFDVFSKYHDCQLGYIERGTTSPVLLDIKKINLDEDIVQFIFNWKKLFRDVKYIMRGYFVLVKKEEIHEVFLSENSFSTQVHALNTQNCIYFYISPQKRIEFLLCSEEKIAGEISGIKADLKKMFVNKKGDLYVSVILKQASLENITLVFEQRNTLERKEFYPIQIKKRKNDAVIKFKLNIFSEMWEQFYWDACIYESDKRIRIKNKSIFRVIKYSYLKYNTLYLTNNKVLFPYITNDGFFSLLYREKSEYDNNKIFFKEIFAFFCAVILKPFFIEKKLWLIHEKFSMTAQDNSFFFFKYCLEEEKYKNVFFIIDKRSRNYKYVEKYNKNIIFFMSFKHMLYIQLANLIVASEAKGHGYVWREPRGIIRSKLNQKRFVFLQHGVLGLKKIDRVFHAAGMNHADLFVVSSNFEQKIVHENLGYKNIEICITGLSRWDYLHHNMAKKKQILCMPTWRNWLEEIDQERFQKSQYFQTYNSLINSPKLLKILKEMDYTLIFYLHPKFTQYYSNFSDSQYIKIKSMDNANLQMELKESKLLITDYSSLAFESYYQDIPVIFYHFDKDKYQKNQGSYIDLTNLFGEISYNQEELLSFLRKSFSIDFQTPDKFKQSKNLYFKYVDNKNSMRIFNGIVRMNKKRNYINDKLYAFKRSLIVRTIWYNVKEYISFVKRYGR